MSDRRELRDDEPADIEILTGVRAKSLRFGEVPETELTFFGDPGERHSEKTERENLPEEVEEHTTYRDVTVRWSVRQRIDHPTDP